MKPSIRHGLSGILLGLFALLPMCLAQEPPSKPPTAEPPAAEPSEAELLERWKSKTPEERKLLHERFETLRGLSKEERKALKQRSVRLGQQRRELERELAAEQRSKLEALPTAERERVLREHQLGQLRHEGESLRSSLPPEHRAWVEGLLDEGPPRPVDRLHDRIRGHFGERTIGRFREGGCLSGEQEARLEGLQGRERMDAFLDMQRVRLVAEVERVGLPEGVDAAKWAELQGEPSAGRFMRRVHRLGIDPLGPMPQGAEGPGPGGARANDGERGPRASRGGEARPEGARPAWGHGDKQRKGTAWIDALREHLRPTMDDRLEFAELPRAERRARMDGAVAQRVRGLLGERADVPEETRAELLELEDAELLERIKVLAGPRDRRSGGFGPGRGEGRGAREGPQPDAERGPRSSDGPAGGPGGPRPKGPRGPR